MLGGFWIATSVLFTAEGVGTRMVYLRILMLVAVVVVVGCRGSESESVDAPEALPAAENAKAVLQEVSESGELGSGMMALRESLESFDEGKALLPDLDALEALSNPDEIMAKAKEMANKL